MIGNIVAGTFSAGVAPVTSSYESIATTTVGSGGNSSITFTSGGVWADYKHLQIRIFGADDASGSDYGYMQFNSDTGNNYAAHQLFGDGSSAQANGFSSINQIYIQRIPGSITSTFGAVVIDILDHGSTSKTKTVRMLGGYDANGSGRISFSSGLWNSTSAITSILLGTGATKWLEHTKIALYGIKD